MLGRRVASVALAALVGMSGAAAVASPAHAVGGDCQTKTGHLPRLGPDHYRVEAHCTSLQADSKARGVLDLAVQGDSRTAWFTQTKVWKYGEWGAYLNRRGTFHEIRHV
jgi:hypothetical protein